MLVLLEPDNRILKDTVNSVVFAEKRTSIDVKLCDFDGATYWVRSDPASVDVITVSVSMPVFKEVEALGAQAMLVDTYGDLLVEPTDGSDIMLRMDLASIPEDNLKELVNVVSGLKNMVSAAPFKGYFDNLRNSVQMDSASFSQHEDCPVFLIPRPDRVVCVFSLNVKENSDRVVTSVFLSEFVEARRKVPSGPIVTFSESPPKELQDAFGIEQPIGNVGFVTFAVLPRHIDTEEKAQKAASLLAGFRTYIQYHIKCSKAYFHSRMRARVVSLLKNLNRAKDDSFDDGKKKQKKTFSGRTFEQSS